METVTTHFTWDRKETTCFKMKQPEDAPISDGPSAVGRDMPIPHMRITTARRELGGAIYKRRATPVRPADS